MKKFLPAVVALCFSVTQCFAQVNVQDSLALVALYNSTNGSGWANKTNWLSGSVDTWYGVTITGNRVTNLSITNNNMVGSLPSELGDLTAIIGLFLSDNEISGTIPASLSNLKEMWTLRLSHNNLTGTIPTSLESLEKLRYLSLEYNTLTGSIPPGLKIANAIALQNNQLSGTVPAFLCDKYLFIFIQNNQFTFDGMECIGANDQARPPMTDQIVFYENQKKLLINNHNPILSVTAGGTLSKNTYTWYKDDGDNAYAAPIGDSTLQITEPGTYWCIVKNSLASQLILYTNTITVASVLTMLQRDSLALIDIYNNTNGAGWTNNTNWLAADIPVDEWAGVTVTNSRISAIDLSNNNLSGEVFRVRQPAGYSPRISNFSGALANLSALTWLSLAHNNLGGNIPATIGNLVNLEYLSLENNNFSGTIPSGICNLPNLSTINISNNQFTFNGMECIAANPGATYASQKMLTITNNNPSLSVTAGGTLIKNTYTWFKNGISYYIKQADSTFTLTEPGNYSVEVTNSDATQLTLISSPVTITSVLPLYWVSFTATNCSDGICLQWQTVNEQNTSHFEIERSVDGNNFIQFSKVFSQNIPGTHAYSTTDHSPAQGINYYRVKQVDLDGRYSYSDIIGVNVETAGKLTISPNPANNFIILTGVDKAERVILYSITGQLLREWVHVNGNQQLNISDLQKGVYIIKVLHHNAETVHKIIKQ